VDLVEGILARELREGHHQLLVVDPDRQAPSAAHQLQGEHRYHDRRDRLGGRVPEVDPRLLGYERDQVALVDHPIGDQPFGGGHPARLLEGERLFEVLLGEHFALDEELAGST
jgi:hypothetical protein